MTTNKVTKTLVAKRLNINSRYVQGDPNVISDRCSQRDLPFPVMRPYEYQGAMYMIPPMPENLTRSTYASVFFSSPTLGDLKRAAEQLGVKKKASKTLNRRNLMAIITGYMLQHKVKEPIFIKKLKSKGDSCIIRRANSNNFNNLNNTNSNNNSLVRKDENYLKNNLGLTPKQLNNYRNANNKQNYLRNSVGLTQSQVRSVPVSAQTMSFVRTPPSQVVSRIASMPQAQRTQMYNSIRRELPQATGGQLAVMKNTMARLTVPNKPKNWTGTRTTVVEHKANKRVANLQSRITKLLQNEKKIDNVKKNVQKSINTGVTTVPQSVQTMVPAAAKTQNMNKIMKALENLKHQSASQRKNVATQASKELVKLKEKPPSKPGFFGRLFSRKNKPTPSKENLNRNAQKRKENLNRNAQKRKENLNRKAQKRRENLNRREKERKEKQVRKNAKKRTEALSKLHKKLTRVSKRIGGPVVPSIQPENKVVDGYEVAAGPNDLSNQVFHRKIR